MEYHMGPANSSEEFEGTGRVIREKPPRRFSLPTKLAIIFGGALQQMGWAFGGFGMIFFWVFVMNSEARYLLAFDGQWVDTDGTISNISTTNSEVNDQVIFAYKFTYNVKGRVMEGTSYGPSSREYEVNSPVAVEYKSRNPERVRIEKMSSSIFPVWVIFVCIFPIIGLAFIFSGLYSNLKALRMLVYGKFTKGKLVNKIPTNTQINNQTVFKYEFEFEVEGQRHIARCQTYQGWKVEDEEMEIILYEPRAPKNSIVYDAVDTVPEINPRGELEPVKAFHLTLLILPSLAIGINAILFYFFVYLDVF